MAKWRVLSTGSGDDTEVGAITEELPADGGSPQ